MKKLEETRDYLKKLEDNIQDNKIQIKCLNDNIKSFKDSLKIETDKKLKKNLIKSIKNEEVNLLKLTKENNKVEKEFNKYKKSYEHMLKPKMDLDFIWKPLTGVFGVTLFLSLFIFAFLKPNLAWMGIAFLMFILFLVLLIFLIYLGKKTHAILEFKSLKSGKPLCLFFTDHKRVDWKVIEPEAGVVHDSKYGSFLVNQKGTYIDEKTKNLLIPFNPNIGTSAPLEAFKLTDALAKVLNDEKKLAELRFALANGEFRNGEVTITDDKGKKEILKPFEAIRESIDFSHLKSLLNTLQPHNINAKIEMQVAQRIGGIGKVNIVQIVLIIVAIIGATALAYVLISTVGGGGETIIREVATPAAQAATTGGGLNG